MRLDDCNKITKYINKSGLPTTKSRMVQDLGIYYPNLLEALQQIIKDKKIKRFKTVNGIYYAKRSWKP